MLFAQQYKVLGKREINGHCDLGAETAAPVRHIENPWVEQGVGPRFGVP